MLSLFFALAFFGVLSSLLDSRLKTTRSGGGGGRSSANFDKVRRLSAGARRDAEVEDAFDCSGGGRRDGCARKREERS